MEQIALVHEDPPGEEMSGRGADHRTVSLQGDRTSEVLARPAGHELTGLEPDPLRGTLEHVDRTAGVHGVVRAECADQSEVSLEGDGVAEVVQLLTVAREQLGDLRPAPGCVPLVHVRRAGSRALIAVGPGSDDHPVTRDRQPLAELVPVRSVRGGEAADLRRPDLRGNGRAQGDQARNRELPMQRSHGYLLWLAEAARW